MNRKRTLLMAAFLTVLPVLGWSDPPRCAPPTATLLASGLEGPIGSTVGPDRALYVAEGIAGRISRIDPNTGQITTFASGLPKRLPGFPVGGPIDITFMGNTAYVLVTLVGPRRRRHQHFWHLSGRRPGYFHGRGESRRVVRGPSAADFIRCSRRTPVCDGALPGRVRR
jgi:hypothetical protein